LTKSAKIESQIIDVKSLESIKDQAPKLAKYVDELSKRNLNCLFKYVNIIKDYALTVGNPLGIYLLLEICSISPFNITKFLHDNVDWFKNQAFSVNEQVRVYSAELWSLILVNNILEREMTANSQIRDFSALNFDPFFDTLLQMNKSILNNVMRLTHSNITGFCCFNDTLVLI
jgi:hypothetical protein